MHHRSHGGLSLGGSPSIGSLSGGLGPGGLCPGGESLSSRVSVLEGLCPGGSLSQHAPQVTWGALSWGSLSWRVSVQGEVSVQGGSLSRGIYVRGGSLSKWSLSGWGSLSRERGICPAGLCLPTPGMVMSGWYASYSGYWNAFLLCDTILLSSSPSVTRRKDYQGFLMFFPTISLN